MCLSLTSREVARLLAELGRLRSPQRSPADHNSQTVTSHFLGALQAANLPHGHNFTITIRPIFHNLLALSAKNGITAPVAAEPRGSRLGRPRPIEVMSWTDRMSYTHV